jgi:hypothetical protein
MSSLNPFPDFEFDALGSTTVTLTPAAVAWALQASQAVVETQQWQTFLAAMALQGLNQWLLDGAQDRSTAQDQLSHDLDIDVNAAELSAQGATCEVNGFRLSLISQGSLSDEVVFLSNNALAKDETSPHFYLLMEVQDERDQVTILGGLRCDRLSAYQQQGRLIHQANGNYCLPITCFDTPPEAVLLFLRCLNPDQLTAETAAAAVAPTPKPPQANALPSVKPGSRINVGQWLRDQLDTVADTLAWTLLPPLATSHALMSASTPAEQLEGMLKELELTGITIPPSAKGAYTDLQPLGTPLRLYALTWPLWTTATSEWSLLLFLGPTPGAHMPSGTHLVVRDQATVLAEQTIGQGDDSSYLYAQVIGTWEEQFTATVTLPDGMTFSWPPFIFWPGVEG